MEKKYFFDGVYEAVMYVIFLSIFPVASIVVQFMVDDRAMYVTYIIACFSVTYDYFMLFKKKMCKRLWREAVATTFCFITAIMSGMSRLTYILASKGEFSYNWIDLVIVMILGIMVAINIIEMTLIIRSDYRERFTPYDANQRKLLEGSQKV